MKKLSALLMVILILSTGQLFAQSPSQLDSGRKTKNNMRQNNMNDSMYVNSMQQDSLWW